MRPSPRSSWLRRLRHGAVALTVVRSVLNAWLKAFLTRKLNESPNRQGGVAGVELHLLEGRVVLSEVRVTSLVKGRQAVALLCRAVSVEVEWKHLLRGTLVGRVVLREPRIEIETGCEPGSGARSPTEALLALCRETQRFLPFRFRSVEIQEGFVQYWSRCTAPAFQVALSRVSLSASNLTNIVSATASETAHVVLTGRTTGNGKLRLKLILPSLADTLTFDLQAEWREVNLVAWNDVLRAYANFDLERGTCSILAEFQVQGGAYQGFVQPHFRDLDVFAWHKDHGKGFFQVCRQAVIGFLAGLFKNQARDELALTVPISGTFADGDVDIWSAVGSLLQNAFVRALFPPQGRMEAVTTLKR